MENKKFSILKLSAWLALSCAALPAWPGSAVSGTVCAVVNLQLNQEAALEREGFIAKLTLTNSLGDLPLSNLRIDVAITDADGNAADSLFYSRVTDLQGVGAVDGTGLVQPSASAAVQWLIVPSPGAGGGAAGGAKYNVKAQMTYNTGGVARVTTTFPVIITVKPQPLIRLEYVLPFEVFGDEPLTPEVAESTVPFYLGVRAVNAGSGTAVNFSIDSAQPVIMDSKQGLPVNFMIANAWLPGGQPADKTLKINFGNIAPNVSAMAAWSMVASLSGRFTSFGASFTHSAALGGALTSLIDSASTYTLIKDVLADMPGRDSQFDFLINKTTPREQMEILLASGQDIQPEYVMESDRAGLSPVTNVPAHLNGTLSGSNAVLHLVYDAGVSTGVWIHASVPAPAGGQADIASAMRANGSVINPRDIWVSRHFDKASLSYVYRLHILDYVTEAAPDYAITFNASLLDMPPSAVADLSADVSAGGVALRWTASGEDGAAGAIYNGKIAVFRSTDTAAAPQAGAANVVISTTVQPGAAQYYVLGDLLGNATHQAQVWMADARGNYSGPSNKAVFFTYARQPSGVAVSSVAATGFLLEWINSANLPGAQYRVKVSSQAGDAGSESGFAADITSYTCSGLAPDVDYTASIQPRDLEGRLSPYSDAAHVTTLANAPAAADAPIIKVATGSVAIAWNANGNPARTLYLVQASTTPDFSGIAASASVSGSSEALDNLLPDRMYTARAAAINGAGMRSAFATIGSTVTLAAMPASALFTGVSSVTASVSWDSGGNPYDTLYHLDISTSPDFLPVAGSSDVLHEGFTFAGLAPATTYFARVRAANRAGVPTDFAAAISTVTGKSYGMTIASFSPQSGPIGTVFTLAGGGFGAYNGSKTVVLIGGATAQLSLWNGTTIQGTIPGALAAGTYTVVAQRIYTSSADVSNAVSFTVTTPSVYGVSPSSGPIGQTFVLAGAEFGQYAGSLTRVLIGGATCPLSLWNGTTVQGTIPGALSAGTYPVVLERRTSDGGSVVAGTVAFTVVAPRLDSVSPSSGPIGMPFTISGSGFGSYAGSYTRVLVGGTTAALSLWNDGKIQGRIPGTLAAGSYAVAVERAASDGGLVRSSTASFTVTEPAITGLAPDNGPIGTAFTLTGHDFGPYAGANTQVRVGDKLAPLSLWNGTTVQGTIPGLEAGQYPVVIEIASGGGLVATNTYYFTVTTPAVAGITPSTAPIGQTFIITGSGFGAYAGSYTRVLIGGVTAQLSLWNGTTIQGTIPGALASGARSVVVERAVADGMVARAVAPSITVAGLEVYSLTPSTAPIGQPFTITGGNFGSYSGSYTTVLIGGVTAQLSLWNGTTIQGVIPNIAAGAQPVVVSRRTADGGLAASATMYLNIVAPVAYSVTPSSGPIGQPFTITGDNFGSYSGSYTTVLIGGVTAQLSLWNSTTIQGTVPGALYSGSYPVVVRRTTSDGGVAESAPLSFAVAGINVSTLTPVAGPIGSVFTIVGENFGSYNGANTRVLIGGTTCPLSLWNGTTIQGTVPGLLPAGPQPVVVERASGGYVIRSATSYFEITVPTLQSVSPSTGPIGMPFTLVGANFGAYNGSNTRVKIGGVVAPLSLWNGTTIQGTVPGSLAAGDYELVVERAASGGGLQASATAYFGVILPQLNSVSPSTAPVGAPFVLTGSGFGNYSGANTAVLINGATQPLSLWTDTKIQGSLTYFTTGQYPVAVKRLASGGAAQSQELSIGVISPTITALTLATNGSGTSFVLTGTGFGPYNGAQINGKPATRVMLDATTVCSLSAWTDVQIRGIIPDSAATGSHMLTAVREVSGGLQSSNGASYGSGGVIILSGAAKGGTRGAVAVSYAGAADPNAGLPLPAEWGGRVESSNRAAVDIAPGAMAEDAFITIATAAVTEEISRQMMQSEARALIMPVGPALNFGPEGMKLASPAALTVPFDRTQIPYGKTERDLALYNWDEGSGSWILSEAELKNGRLEAKTSHLSLYQPMVQGVNPLASNAFAFRQFYVYPNPAKNGNTPKLHLECGVGDGADIRIYDVSGQLRHSGHMDGGPNVLLPEYAYEYEWNMSGAGSGVYTAVIEAHKAGETVKAKKKFAIVR
ncbi:MAG: IPT/TIG domain-containing protein [Elusimicrobiales bacterium]